MDECDHCKRIIDAWVAAQGESALSEADRVTLHSPKFRDHVNNCVLCSTQLGEASSQIMAMLRQLEEQQDDTSDEVLRAHLLKLFESRGLLTDDGRLAGVPAPSAFNQARNALGDSEAGNSSALVDAIRNVGGHVATLVGTFRLPLPRTAPATLGADRDQSAVSPPLQVALSMPALTAGSWQSNVTLEIRPTQVSMLLTASPNAQRTSLATPCAAIRTAQGTLLMAGDSEQLRWLGDESNRCYLTVWRAITAAERLEDLVDPSAEDSLVVWMS